MSVNREVNRAGALLVLVTDLKMSQLGAESLVAEADERPGEWRQFGKIKIRKVPQKDRFEVRG